MVPSPSDLLQERLRESFGKNDQQDLAFSHPEGISPRELAKQMFNTDTPTKGQRRIGRLAAFGMNYGASPENMVKSIQQGMIREVNPQPRIRGCHTALAIPYGSKAASLESIIDEKTVEPKPTEQS